MKLRSLTKPKCSTAKKRETAMMLKGPDHLAWRYSWISLWRNPRKKASSGMVTKKRLAINQMKVMFGNLMKNKFLCCHNQQWEQIIWRLRKKFWPPFWVWLTGFAADSRVSRCLVSGWPGSSATPSPSSSACKSSSSSWLLANVKISSSPQVGETKA